MVFSGFSRESCSTKDIITIVCADNGRKGHTDIKSGDWKLFYKSCGGDDN
jgi:hypothetical protein